MSLVSVPRPLIEKGALIIVCIGFPLKIVFYLFYYLVLLLDQNFEILFHLLLYTFFSFSLKKITLLCIKWALRKP